MARREHTGWMLPSAGTTAPSPAAMLPGDTASGEARGWSLKQEHIEKALRTIAPYVSTRAQESERAGAWGAAGETEDAVPRIRSKPRAWQEVS